MGGEIPTRVLCRCFYAWGDITQLGEAFREVELQNSAYGIGPVAVVRLTPVQLRRFSLLLDVSGAFILYSQDFPAGGDFYNFMWRAGPALAYELSHEYGVSIRYSWMHVSNGQGFDQDNPSYDARGVSVNAIRYL